MLRCGARTTSAWEAARVRHHRSMRSAPRTGAYASVRIIVRCANAPTPHTSRILRTYRTTHVPAHVHTPCMQHTCPTAAACANLGRGDDDKAPQRLHQKAMPSLLARALSTPDASLEKGRRPHNGTFLHDGQRCGSSAVHHYKYTPLDSAVKYPALSQRCAPLSLQMQRLRAALCRLAAAVITLN